MGNVRNLSCIIMYIVKVRFSKKTVIYFIHIKGVLAEQSSRGFGLFRLQEHNSYYHKVRINIILAFGEKNIYKTYLHIMQM